jgi:hypothetical protein
MAPLCCIVLKGFISCFLLISCLRVGSMSEACCSPGDSLSGIRSGRMGWCIAYAWSLLGAHSSISLDSAAAVDFSAYLNAKWVLSRTQSHFFTMICSESLWYFLPCGPAKSVSKDRVTIFCTNSGCITSPTSYVHCL